MKAAGLADAVPVLYGIPNCDTVKKARCWLDDQGQPHRFHDFKKLGVPAAHLAAWIGAVGLETLVNRRGPSFRKLDAATQARAGQPGSAAAVLAELSSVIKRPVVEWPDGSATVGFDASQWQQRLPVARSK